MEAGVLAKEQKKSGNLFLMSAEHQFQQQQTQVFSSILGKHVQIRIGDM